MTQYDATTYCPGCRELWTTLGVWHICPAPEPPQDARSGSTDAAIPPGGTPRHCIICGGESSVHMTTAPVCQDHASPVAFERALREARSETARLRQEYAEFIKVSNVAHQVMVDECDALDQARAEARAERDTARGWWGQVAAQVRDMEWGDMNGDPTVFGVDIGNDACLVCGSRRHMGHRPDCELLPLLALLAAGS